MRFADERPQIATERETYVYYPGTQAVPENVAVKVLNRAHSHHRRCRDRRPAPRACWPATAATWAATSCSSRTASCTTCTTTSARRSFACRPTSRCPPEGTALRYEFEPTGAPDLKAGRGTPGTAKLFVDGNLVGQADSDVTVPLALGLGSGFAVGSNPGSPCR